MHSFDAKRYKKNVLGFRYRKISREPGINGFDLVAKDKRVLVVEPYINICLKSDNIWISFCTPAHYHETV